jgi:lipopolysaccharide transport system permease protein
LNKARGRSPAAPTAGTNPEKAQKSCLLKAAQRVVRHQTNRISAPFSTRIRDTDRQGCRRAAPTRSGAGNYCAPRLAAAASVRLSRHQRTDALRKPKRNPGFGANGNTSPQEVRVLADVLVIEPQHGWRSIDFGELWRYRELLYFLIWRDIKVRYKQTVIGAAWAILQPLCQMVIFSVIFGAFARIPSEGFPYPIFVYAGLLPWTFFANAVAQSSVSLVNQSQLLTKVYFPRLFIPSSSIGVGLVDFGLSFCVYVCLMLWYGHMPSISVALLPLLLLLTMMTALGVGVFLASVTVAYRDFRLVVPFMVQIWMYLSPVVYAVTLVPERYRWIMAFNPMTGIIGGFRSALLDQPVDWNALGISAVVASLVLLIGVSNFRRTERRFADIA